MKTPWGLGMARPRGARTWCDAHVTAMIKKYDADGNHTFDISEFTAMVREIKEFQRASVPLSDIAVLYRTHAVGRSLAPLPALATTSRPRHHCPPPGAFAQPRLLFFFVNSLIFMWSLWFIDLFLLGL